MRAVVCLVVVMAVATAVLVVGVVTGATARRARVRWARRMAVV